MKICISATGNNLDATLDPRFGRAMYFLIVNDKEKLIKAIKNTGVQAMRGAGVAAAQIAVKEKVDAVITGNIGPNAFMVLSNSGIKVFLGNPAMSIQDVFQEYQKGNLQEVTSVAPRQLGFGPGPGQRRKGLGGRGRGRK